MAILETLVPQSLHSLWLLPTALLLATLIYVIYLRCFHPLSSIPGPFLASITRLWLAKHAWDGDLQWTMIRLHKQHGPLVRTGPNEISVADPIAIKTIYSASSKFRKSDWYSVWQGHRKFDLFGERNAKVHGEQRRLVSRPYSMAAMKDLEPYVDSTVKVFLEKMDEREGKVVDMGKWVHLFAFDVIGEISFSKRFGFIDAGQDDGSFAQIQAAMRSGGWVGQIPSLYWLHDRLTPYIGNHLGIAARHGSLRQFAMREISARKDRGTDHNDILAKLFATQAEKPDEMNENAVTSMATSNIFAGSDSTAISMRAILYFLLKNPQAKKKLVEEVDRERREGRLSDPVQFEEAERMPYLQAVMYEALRLHPAVGFNLPRVVPEEGIEICGKYIPAGTVVGTNAWVIHRNEEIFGEDVEAFRPERWMKDDTHDMQRFFLAFGAGSRTCVGRNISWMEMSKLIPTLFMHYNLELGDPKAEWTMKAWWFVVQSGVNITLTRRRSST